MARRVINALLIASYLVGQAAAVPHAHGKDCNHGHSEHGVHRHVHLNWLNWFGQIEYHCDHDCDDCHHDYDQCGSHSNDVVVDEAPGRSPHDHDHDAIYLPESIGGPSLTVKTVVPVDWMAFCFVLPAAPVCVDAALCCGAESAVFPGGSHSDSPLYLMLRALRI